MKFDYCIGNPPYQADIQNEGDRANPLYDKFMDAAFEIADNVELIHPARFLFNAGQTSKAWNEKMLQDPHFKVLYHEIDSSVVFPNTDIKGGVAISYRNPKRNYGAIGTFTSYPELNGITQKVNSMTPHGEYIDTITSSRGMYRFSDVFYTDYPNAKDLVGKGSGNMVVSNAFEKMPDVFTTDEKPESLKILGRVGSNRTFRYVNKKYIIPNEYLSSWNVLVPEANGTGAIGEVLSTPLIGEPLIGEPLIGVTDTFISIGTFETENKAVAALKYIKSRFARTMLGVNKVTQHNPKSTWKNVPLQDFSSKSDIDWSQSVAEIDRQLYKKYGLSEEEIQFIETHVKEME